MGDLIFRKSVLLGAFALGMSLSSVHAQGVDEVIVTGSNINQSAEDAPVPVDVINSEDLFNIGNPSVVELVKTLGVSSGVDGETNQFQSNGLEGTANVNLRGLGAGRNLVLPNGRRNVWSPYAISEQSQLFVDINMIPAVALGRVELLKDGAAATYGSDAISGMVNFITRNDFEGFEAAVSHKAIDGSDGDQDLGLIWGHDFGNTHIMSSFGYSTRSQLKVTDRDWTINPRGTDANLRGYSSSPNPGAFLSAADFRDSSQIRTRTPSQADIRLFNHDNDGATSEVTPVNAFLDPRCTDISGSFAQNDGRCTYNYTYFDNLIEEEERTNIFTTLTHDFADDTQLTLEFLYGENETPEWHTSPSYPQQLDFDTRYDTGRYVYAWHPGLAKLGADHPTLRFGDDTGGNAGALVSSIADEDCTASPADDCRSLLFYGRPLGASGPAEKRGSRENETIRLAVGLEGNTDLLGNNLDYTTSLLWTQADGQNTSYDAVSERWSEALEGYGLCGRLDANGTTRPVSDRADQTGASAGCAFFNPFSNAIEKPQQKYTSNYVNPDYEEGLENSQELYEWMSVAVGSNVESSLVVWDGVITGELDANTGWALGGQYREETYKTSPYAISNLHVNPCASVAENIEFRDSGRTYNPNGKNCAGEDGDIATAADNYVGSGPFTFLAGATPFDDSQDIIALFGKLALAPHEDLDIQLSARYEDYGGKVGDTVDPKIAVRWQANDNIVVRSSASTTFRGPTLNQLGGRGTTLSFLNAVGTFKAIDTIGNPNLKPETAKTFNAGVLFNFDGLLTGSDNLNLSVDYWSFDFEDPIIKENFNAIASASFTSRAFNADSAYADRVFCGANLCSEGDSIGSISRITTNLINGPDIETDGFDIAANYGREVFNGDLDVSLQWTVINSYDVGASALNSTGFDAKGRINDTVSFLRPIVENKAALGVKYTQDVHTFNFVSNYTDSYSDADSIVGIPLTAIFGSNIRKEVEEQLTFDLHYNLSLENFGDDLEESALWVSIYNATDEDPPFARLDLNYDPYTHNPFGRIIKVGVRHRF